MPDETINFRGDATSLLNAINQAVNAYNNLRRAQDQAQISIVKFSETADKQTGVLKAQVGAFKTATQTYETIKDVNDETKVAYQLLSTTIQDNTQKVKEQQKVINKQLSIQAAARRSAAQLAEAEERLARARKLKDDQALINKQLSIQEAARRSALRLAQAEAQAAEAIRRRAQAQAIRGVRGTREGLTAGVGSEKEIAALRKAELAVVEYATANKIAARQILSLWTRVAQGRITLATGTTKRLQELLISLKAAHNNLGKEAVTAAQRARKATDALKISWQSLFRLLGAQLVYRAVFGLGQQIREAIDLTIQLNVAISEIQTISPPTESFQEWSDVLFQLSNRFGIDIIDQAEAAYQSLSNQIVDTAEQFLQFGTVVNEFALATKSTAEDSVNLLTGTLNAFRKEATEAEDVAAKLFKTIELGRVRANEMADSIGNVAVIGNQLGVTLEELLGLISTLTIQGIKFSEAATQIRGIMVKLLKPTEETKKFIAELGFESAEAAIKVLGFTDFISKLIEKSKGSSTEIAKFINRIRGLTGILAITGSGFTLLEDNIQEITDATSNFDRAVQLTTQNLGKRFQIVFNEIKNFFIQDFATNLLKDIDSLTFGFKLLSVAIKVVATTISTLLVPAIVTLTTALSVLVARNILKTLTNPYTILLGVLTVVISTISHLAQAERKAYEDRQKLIDKQIALVEKEVEAYQKGLDDIVDAINKAIDNRTRGLERASAEVKAFFIADSKEATKAFEEISDKIKDITKQITKELDRQLKELKDNLDDVTKSLDDVFTALIERSKEFDEIKFEISLDDKSLEDQIAAFEQRLIELTKKREITSQAGDLAGTEELNKAILDLAQRIIEAQRDLAESQIDAAKDLSKEASKSAEDLADLEVKLAEAKKKLDELRQDEARARARGRETGRTPDLTNKERGIADTIDEINQLQAAIEATTLKTEELRRAVKAIEIDGQRVDAFPTIDQAAEAALQRITQRALARLSQLEVEEQTARATVAQLLGQQHDAEEQILKTRQQQVDALTDLISKSQEFDLENVQSLENVDAIRQAFEDQAKILREIIDLQKQLGVDPVDISTFENALKTLAKLRTDVVSEAEVQAALLNLQTEIDNLKGKIGFDKEQTEALLAQAATLQKLIAEISALTQFSPEKRKAFEGTELFKQVLEDSPLGLLLKSLSEFRPEDISRFEAFADAVKRLQETKSLEDAKSTLLALEQIFINLKQVDFTQKDGQLGQAAQDLQRLREFRRALQELVDSGQGVADILVKAGDLQQGIVDAQDALKALEQQQKDTIEKFGGSTDKFANAIDTFIDGLNKAIDRLDTVLQQVTAGTGQPFAEGGVVGGTGNTDSVRAMLTPGEFVVNKDATKQFYTQLRAMNSGINPQRYASGGMVEVGGITVHVSESRSPQSTAREVVAEINRGIRQGSLQIRRR